MSVISNNNNTGHQQVALLTVKKARCCLLAVCLSAVIAGPVAAQEDTGVNDDGLDKATQHTEALPLIKNESDSDADSATTETATTDAQQSDPPTPTGKGATPLTDLFVTPESVMEAQIKDIQTLSESEIGRQDREDPQSACDRTRDLMEQEATWYDSAHAVMNTAFCEPAVWFDDFFASDRIFEEVAGTYVRWRNDVFYNQEDGYEFNTNLNFSIELPKISSKLKLIFEGDEDQALQDVLPGSQAESTNNTLGLRVDVKDTSRSKFNISLSARPRIRLRYRYTYPARDDFLIRFTQEIQNEKGVNGARTRLDFEKAFLPLKLLRATTEFFAAEDFPGVEWAQAFSFFKRITKKSSVSYEASIVGITRPNPVVTNSRLGIRYRQNIHRDWLFFEVSPDVTWPIDLSEDRETILKERRSVYSILVRLEVHFGNAKRRRYSDFF